MNKIFSNVIFRTKKENKDDCRIKTHIMIVPQFSLGGKLKSGKTGTQYHQCESPKIASNWYHLFCQTLNNRAKKTQKEFSKTKSNKNLATYVQCGVFGNRQGLKIESDGPFSHFFDIIQTNDQSKQGSKSQLKKQSQSQSQSKSKKSKCKTKSKSHNLLINEIQENIIVGNQDTSSNKKSKENKITRNISEQGGDHSLKLTSDTLLEQIDQMIFYFDSLLQNDQKE